MKEIEEKKPAIEQHQLKNKQQELTFSGSMRRPHNGMKLFFFNIDTREVSEVQFNGKAYYDAMTGQPKTESEMIRNKDCMYLWAINKKSATKKFNKIVLEQ